MRSSGSFGRFIDRVSAFFPPENVDEVIRSALWLGIVFGVLEAAIAVWLVNYRHLPIGSNTTAEIFWTTPLAASLSMLVLASGLLVVTAPFRAAARWRAVIVPMLMFVGTYFTLRLMRVGISPPAALMLALGIATFVFRARKKNSAALSRAVRRTLPFMTGALLLLALGIRPWRNWREHRLIQALPAAEGQRPNVLIIIWDTARALDLSLYGYERETTPELKRLAASGTTFNRAFSTAPWTLPSHASMFTGRYPFELSTGWRFPLDDRFPTIAEVFGRNGYATGGFIANRYFLTPEWGTQRGFATYSYAAEPTLASIAASWSFSREVQELLNKRLGNHADVLRRSARDVTDAFLSWQRRIGDRPFFAVLNEFDAHVPYFPPAPFNRAFSERQPRYWADDEFHGAPGSMIGQLRTAYDGSLKYLDHELGRLLQEMRTRGQLDNTIVVVTSDHGEELGSHAPNVNFHGTALFTTSTLVPLVVVYPPRIRAQHRSNDNVSIRDIPATVMDLAGVRNTAGIPGTSLAAIDTAGSRTDRPILSMSEKRSGAESLPSWSSGRGELFSVALGDLHYIRDGTGQEHVYNLARDIWEQTDLVTTPEGTAALERFRGILDSAIVRPAGALRARAPAPKKK